MNNEERREVAEKAQRLQIPVLEDDVYGFLNYSSQSYAPIKSIWDEGVYYVGSLSKLIAPSLRVGWIVTPRPEDARYLETVREANDLYTTSIGAQILTAFLENHDFDRLVEEANSLYRDKRDHITRELRRVFGSELTYSIPDSGFFIWATCNRPINTTELLRRCAIPNGVTFVPGKAFQSSPGTSFESFLRLSFSLGTYGEITEGVERLAYFYQQFLNDTMNNGALNAANV